MTTSSQLASTGQKVLDSTGHNSSAFIQMRTKPQATTFSSKALSFHASTDAGFGKPAQILMNSDQQAPFATYDGGLTTNRETHREQEPSVHMQIQQERSDAPTDTLTSLMNSMKATAMQGRYAPQKQAKKYKMSLGQNEGPFKARDPYGAPLVDMFSPQGYYETEQDSKTGQEKLKRRMSPKIGILGANTFSAEGNHNRRLDNQPSNTVNKTMRSIEEQMVLGYELLAAFKQEASNVRSEMDELMQDLVEKVENVQDDTSPEIYKDYKQLKHDIGEQRQENHDLKKQLEKVARETQEQREKVALFQEHILVMEEQVGMMEYNEKYKQSVYEPIQDDLFQEDSKIFASKEHVLKEPSQQQVEVENNAFHHLNPASTTSSFERIHSAQKLPEVVAHVYGIKEAHLASAADEIKVEQL